MQFEDCTGEATYQDETNHRNPCKEQAYCSKGEYISDQDREARRTCHEIPLDETNYYQKYAYMDKDQHRNLLGTQTQPVCNMSDILFFEDTTGDNRIKVKKEGNCISRVSAADKSFDKCE